MKRVNRYLLAAAACVAAQAANAELHVGGGLEYFHWEENTQPVVEETGPTVGFHVAYIQDKARGPLFGLKGRIWGGSVDYEGALLANNQPVSGDTSYFGVGGEGQLRLRSSAGGQKLDGIVALGLDSWTRQLTRDQSEQYTVLSVRLGFELEPEAKRRGLLAGLGVRYPFYIYEDARFDEIGAFNNPALRPKGRPSLTAHLGLQIDAAWRVVGYFESFRMKESAAKFVDFSAGSGLPDGYYFQPDSDMTIIGVRIEYRAQ